MEIEFLPGKIIFDRELSNLDKFVLKFVKKLEEQKIKYVIISGYIPILFGRSRGTEDVDLFVEKMNFERFEKLWDVLLKEFDCINAFSARGAYDDYLLENCGIRFAEKGEFMPNFEFKFGKNEIDEFSLNNSVEVVLSGSKLLISPLELQIPFKLKLGSEKDIEDARYLYKLFKEKLNKDKLNYWIEKLGVKLQNQTYLGA